MAFIDSDDFISEKFIESLYKLSVENNADIVQCQYQEFSDGKEEFNCEEEIFLSVINGKQMIERLYSDEYINTVIACNKLYKKYLFNEIRFPKEKTNEDEFTTYKLYWNANNKIVVTNDKLYYYRKNSSSIMGKKFNKNRLDYIEALEERCAFFEQNGEKDLYQKTLSLYGYILVEYYCLIKKHIKNSKEEQKQILKKFKRNYKKIIELNINNTTKIKYKIFRICPSVLRIILNIKRGKQ